MRIFDDLILPLSRLQINWFRLGPTHFSSSSCAGDSSVQPDLRIRVRAVVPGSPKHWKHLENLNSRCLFATLRDWDFTGLRCDLGA